MGCANNTSCVELPWGLLAGSADVVLTKGAVLTTLKPSSLSAQTHTRSSQPGSFPSPASAHCLVWPLHVSKAAHFVLFLYQQKLFLGFQVFLATDPGLCSPVQQDQAIWCNKGRVWDPPVLGTGSGGTEAFLG